MELGIGLMELGIGLRNSNARRTVLARVSGLVSIFSINFYFFFLPFFLRFFSFFLSSFFPFYPSFCIFLFFVSFFFFLVADTQLYTLSCWSVGRSVRRSVGPSVRHIFEFRAVFALLLLPNCPWLDCRVSGLVFFTLEWRKKSKFQKWLTDGNTTDRRKCDWQTDHPTFFATRNNAASSTRACGGFRPNLMLN